MLDLIWTPPAQQSSFRLLLDAMSRPGRVIELSAQLDGAPARLGVLAVLVDGTVTLADPDALLRETDRRFLEARSASADQALYVVADGSRSPDFTPLIGELGNPERSATLVLEVDAVGDGPLALTLEGPGIKGLTDLSLTGLDREWLARRLIWNRHFPLGVDLVLVDETRAVALPRSTRITLEA